MKREIVIYGSAFIFAATMAIVGYFFNNPLSGYETVSIYLLSSISLKLIQGE